MTDSKKEERNRRRREAYAAKKAGENALRNARQLDAFYSSQTGAGITGTDKFTSYFYGEDNKLDSSTLENLYVQNDIAATIVERIVHDALREGYLLDWSGATDEELREVKDWAEGEYGLTDVVKRADIYGRLFGGGAVFLGIDGDPEKPAMMGRSIDFIRAVPSTELDAATWYADPTSQNFGRVAQYRWSINTFAPKDTRNNTGRKSKKNTVVALVDESRTVPTYGILTTDERFRENVGWGDSVLQRVFEVLKKFETSYDAVLHALTENSIPVYKVEGLLKMLQSENADLLRARFALLNSGKSNYNAIVLGETEDFTRVEAKLNEASNVVETAMMRVSGAANMPATILFGRSPAGMNATGASDLENWHQQVSQHQTLVVAPVVRKIYRWLLAQVDSPLGGNVPEDLKVEFPPLWTPSLQDQVNFYAQVAGADAAYINSKVLLPEEVAEKRAQEPGIFPKIDVEQRREVLEMRKERLMDPPTPPTVAPNGEEPEAPEDGENEEQDESDSGDA